MPEMDRLDAVMNEGSSLSELLARVWTCSPTTLAIRAAASPHVLPPSTTMPKSRLVTIAASRLKELEESEKRLSVNKPPRTRPVIASFILAYELASSPTTMSSFSSQTWSSPMGPQVPGRPVMSTPRPPAGRGDPAQAQNHPAPDASARPRFAAGARNPRRCRRGFLGAFGQRRQARTASRVDLKSSRPATVSQTSRAHPHTASPTAPTPSHNASHARKTPRDERPANAGGCPPQARGGASREKTLV